MKLLNFENGASLFTFDKSNIVWQYNFIIAILLLLKAQSELYVENRENLEQQVLLVH
jgi:hypothetical protein